MTIKEINEKIKELEKIKTKIISEKATEWLGEFSKLFKREENGNYSLISPITDEGDGWILPSKTYVTVNFAEDLVEISTSCYSNGNWFDKNYKFDDVEDFKSQLNCFFCAEEE